MKTLIVVYSHTGNNGILGEILGRKLSADTEVISVRKNLRGFDIFLDMMLNRRPDLDGRKYDPTEYDLVVMVAPVWFGKIAAPLRSYIREYRSDIGSYAFVTVSGGALGKNPKIPAELVKLTGNVPVETLQLYISDMLPENEKKDMNKTSEFKPTERDLITCFSTAIDDFIKTAEIALTRAQY